MKGKDRNTPCWCGSGKKYKKCHLNRASQSKDSPWAAVEANRKAFTRKRCCAHDAGLGPCKGGIVKAHTISRGPNLSRIAEQSHVTHYTATYPELKKNRGKLSVKKTGIKDASVFYGFCSLHDKKLFSCIEDEPFTGNPDQCISVAYRTLSRELYGKGANNHLRETLRSADKGMSIENQRLFQGALEAYDQMNKAAYRDLEHTHKALTAALAKKKTNVLKSLVLEFNSPLPFMFAGAWSPCLDLYERQIQDEHSEKLLDQIFFSSFFGEKTSTICISWKNKDMNPAKKIADQIAALSNNHVASACLQIVMKNVENIFLNQVGLITSTRKAEFF